MAKAGGERSEEVLMRVIVDGPITAAEIAAVLNTSRDNVYGALRRLERLGEIERAGTIPPSLGYGRDQVVWARRKKDQ